MICLTHLLLGIVLKLLVLSRIFAERIFEDCIDLVELLDTFGCMIVYLFLSARNVLRDIYAKTYKITSKTTSVEGVRWCTVYNDDTSLRMRPEQLAQPIAFFLVLGLHFHRNCRAGVFWEAIIVFWPNRNTRVR